MKQIQRHDTAINPFLTTSHLNSPTKRRGSGGEQLFTCSLSQPTLLLSARLDPRLLHSGGDISPLQSSAHAPEQIEHRLVVHHFGWRNQRHQDNPRFAAIDHIVRVRPGSVGQSSVTWFPSWALSFQRAA